MSKKKHDFPVVRKIARNLKRVVRSRKPGNGAPKALFSLVVVVLAVLEASRFLYCEYIRPCNPPRALASFFSLLSFPFLFSMPNLVRVFKGPLRKTQKVKCTVRFLEGNARFLEGNARSFEGIGLHLRCFPECIARCAFPLS